MLVDLLTLVGLPTIDPMLRRAKEIRQPQNQLDILKKISVSWLKMFLCVECNMLVLDFRLFFLHMVT
jgi:hypothetical protein